MSDHNEAMRLAEPPNIENLKKIAASDSTTAIRNALLASIKWIQCLEQSLKFEQAASFRDQVDALTAERDTLRAEVERLRVDAERYEWLRSAHWSDAPLCCVLEPKANVRLGATCPSGDQLDTAIDTARKATQ